METQEMVEERRKTVNMLYYAANTVRRISNIGVELENVKKKYLPTTGGYKTPWHGIKPIGKKLLLLVLGLVLSGSFVNSLNQMVWQLYSIVGLSVNAAIIVMGIVEVIAILLFPVIGQIVANKVITKKNQENADRLERNRQYNENVVYPEEQRVLKKLGEAGRDYAKVEQYLPSHYKYNADALKFMASAIEQGRADSIGQAINLYEEDQHRRRVEDKLDEQNRLQEEQNRLREAQLMATFAEIDAINNMNRRAANGYY